MQYHLHQVGLETVTVFDLNEIAGLDIGKAVYIGKGRGGTIAAPGVSGWLGSPIAVNGYAKDRVLVNKVPAIFKRVAKEVNQCSVCGQFHATITETAGCYKTYLVSRLTEPEFNAKFQEMADSNAALTTYENLNYFNGSLAKVICELIIEKRKAVVITKVKK